MLCKPYREDILKLKLICTKALPLIGRTCFPFIFTGKNNIEQNANFYVINKYFINVETVCFQLDITKS